MSMYSSSIVLLVGIMTALVAVVLCVECRFTVELLSGVLRDD